MSCIKNGAKIGCKYLTLADRGLTENDQARIGISKGVYTDAELINNDPILLENIPYYLFRETISNNNLLLNNKGGKNNPSINLGEQGDNTIVRAVRNNNDNLDRNKRIFMFYSISNDKKPIFVFLLEGSSAWNVADNSGIIFAQLDKTVLSCGKHLYAIVKDFFNKCFDNNNDFNINNEEIRNYNEEYIRIPIGSLPGEKPPINELADILSGRLENAGKDERIVTINKFGLQYAKAIIDSQITNNKILESLFPGNQNKNLRDSYKKNLEGMQTLFKDCDVVRTYENNVIDNINIREANRNGNIKEPRNLIVFGAPGTGKSFQFNEEAKLFDKIERVTFYPSYSYSQFVGCYKPVMKGENISYSFVPGPFLRTYVDAVNDSSNNYLLIIEEINRADAASVFGDVFQLLDRDQYGNSVYSISASEDIKKYLEGKVKNTDNLSIPSNMYIWATMNSADQGVFPMDTAFKRRWDFLYFDLDGNPIGDNPNCPVTKSNWEDIRKAINEWLCEKKVNEDKHLGKYFLNVGKNVEEKDFRHAFKNKVLMYLYEDAARAFRSELFENNSFSAILRDFNEKGTNIFKPANIRLIANGEANGEERANE